MDGLWHWLADQLACLVVRHGRVYGYRFMVWGPFWLYDGENQATLGCKKRRLYTF